MLLFSNLKKFILEGNIYFDSSEIKAKMASVIEKKQIAFGNV